MNNLITSAEFATFRNISQKIDVRKIDEAISLAQQSDLVDLLGDFYFDVLKNKDDDTYSVLMHGGDFTYEDDEYTHAGIKSILADFTYARYIYSINVNLTPFGAVKKEMNQSSNVERNTLKDLAKQSQIDGGNKFKFTRLYLLSNPTLFSRFAENKCKRGEDTGFISNKITKIC